MEQVKQAFEEQRLTGRRLGEIAVGHGWVTSADLAQALADQFGLEYVDLSETQPDRDAATLLPEGARVPLPGVPVRFLADDLLLVAVADPTDVGRADDLRLALGHNVRLAVSEPADLERAIKKLYRTQIEVDQEEEAAEDAASSSAPPSARRSPRPAASTPGGQARPHDDGAGDRGRRLRHPLRAAGERDGRPRADRRRDAARSRPIPKQMQPAVVSRLKIMGQLDIAERRAPQDGRVSVRFGGEPLDLRIAVLPTTHGEQVVLRILHRAVSKPDLDRARHDAAAREQFEQRDPPAVRRRDRLRADRQRQDDDPLHRRCTCSTTRAAC